MNHTLPPPASEIKPVRPVLALMALFTLLFAVLIPTYMALHDHNYWYALDYYRMPMQGGDYLATFSAALRWLSGKPIYTIPDSLNRLYSYPPIHVILFAPLAWMRFETSYLAWTVISGALIITSIFLASA